MMKSARYKYSTFNEMTSQDDYNFYGIIYDASFPQLDEGNDPNSNTNPNGLNTPKYECTIKLIDHEVNPLTCPNDFNDKVINLIIKSNNKESIPYIHSIGDIIRVHNGIYTHKKKRNIYIQLSNTSKKCKASWCIFYGASIIESKDTNPILCSHSNYTFESQDAQLIQFMRGWIKQNMVLKNSISFSFESKLIKRSSNKDKEEDAIVQVVYKTELEDQMVYYVQDETDGCELHTFKYFHFIEVNEVIRLRGFRVIDKNVIVMNQYSNILKIPPFTDYYKEFMKRMEHKLISTDNKDPLQPSIFDSKDQGHNIKDKPDPIRIIETPKIFCSKLKEEDYEGLDIKRFDDISPYEQRFIIDVNVIDILPKNINDSLNILCENCNAVYKINSVELNLSHIFKCSSCKKETKGIIHFNMVLQCIENLYTNKIITIHLCTYDNTKDSNIFGIPASDCYNSEKSIEYLQNRINILLQQDSYIRVKCETYETNNKDNHCIYRIIGDYAQFQLV